MRPSGPSARPAIVAGLALVLFLTLALSGIAGAQEVEERLTIREVDTTEFPVVRLAALSNGGEVPDPADFTLRENGRFVTGFRLIPVSETSQEIGIVLVIDTSGSMEAGGAMDQAKAAARQFVEQRLTQDRIAIVAFSGNARVVQDFTADGAALVAAIDGLEAGGETALWDGVRIGAGLFAAVPELQANIVVLSDGTDTRSTTTASEAVAAVTGAEAALFAIGLPGSDFDEGPVREFAQSAGGTYTTAADPGSLSAVYSAVQRSLQGQFDIEYTSTANESTIQLALSTGSAQARAEAPVGSVAAGSSVEPKVITPEEGPLRGESGLIIGIGLAFLAGALALWAIISSVVKEPSPLEVAMRPYEPAPTQAFGFANQPLVQTPLIQRAVDFTEGVARRQGLLPVVEGLLEKADLPIRAAEALFFYVAGVVVLGTLAIVAAGGLLPAFLALLVIVLGPPALVSFLGGKRQRAFVSQLPDTLQLLAGSLRAGYSLMQGIEAVSKEVQEPMGKELRRVLAEARLGRPVEDSLDDAAERLQSPDFTWAVMAIRIQREVGGNLAELLVTVADTMTARERLRRDIRSLTAEGRVSAIVLAILPVAIGAAVYVLNREYMQVLLDETIGHVMLAITAVLAIVGFLWLKKTIDIEV